MNSAVDTVIDTAINSGINLELTPEQIAEFRRKYEHELEEYRSRGVKNPRWFARRAVNWYINMEEFKSASRRILFREGFIQITTEYMGSCECGDCYCAVYGDGTIEYYGQEAWQKSERRPPMRDVNGAWAEPHRNYNSELSEDTYDEAMRLAKLAVKKIPSWAIENQK